MKGASIALLIVLASCFSFAWSDDNRAFTIVGSRTIQQGLPYSVYLDTSKLERNDNVIIRMRDNTEEEEKLNYEGRNIYEFNVDEKLSSEYRLTILSHHNGMCAFDEIPIFPVLKEYSVFVQMDKPLYKPRDAVRFRVVMIDEKTRPFKPKSLQVIIKEAQGDIVRTFNVNTKEIQMGIYDNTFDLADEPNLGMWSISVIVNERKNEMTTKSFEVKEYVLPLLNINITSNSFLLHTDNTLRVFVSAKYSFGIIARGSARVTAKVQDKSKIILHTITKNLVIETAKAIDFNMVRELKIKPTDPDRLIDIVVDFTDDLTGKTFTKIKNVTYRDKNSFYIRLFNPKTFVPANHYEFYVSIRDFDGIPQHSKAYPVQMNCEYRSNNMNERAVQPSFLDQGFAKFSWFVPKDVPKLKITVSYRDTSRTFEVMPGNVTKIEDFEAVILTKEPSMHEMISLQLNGVSKIGIVNYAVTGRLGLVESGSYNCQRRMSCEISITPNNDMLPEATVMVYFVNDNGDIIYDTSKIYFKQISSNHLNIKMPLKKMVAPGSQINIDLDSMPNSLVALLGIDEALTYLRIGHDIDDVDVKKDLLLFGHTEFTLRHPRVKIIDQSFVYYQNFRNLRECTDKEKEMLIEAGVLIDGGRSSSMRYRSLFKRSIGEDEYSIIPESLENDDDPDEPRVRRDFREIFLYDTAWIDRYGRGKVDVQLPDKITTWLITGFAMNQESGFALAEPALITTIQQMFIKLFVPYSIKFGEILKVDATVFNFIVSKNALKVDVTMVSFDDNQQYFEFIEFDGCQPRIVEEDELTKTVSVKQNSAGTVFFHIRALKSGQIKILVKAISSRAKDAVEQTLNVEHEGTPYYQTENTKLDLTDVSEINEKIQFMPANESIPGSLKFYASVTSTVIPIFPPPRTTAGDDFVNHLFIQPTGCPQQITYKFVFCVIAYNYLKARNILSYTQSTNLNSYITTGYQQILKFRRNDGSFHLWGSDLWMTAYNAKLFAMAKNAIYINDEHVRSSLNYLRNNQGYNGGYEKHNSISEVYSHGNADVMNVKMTAFVLTAFLENAHLVSEYNNVIVKGLQYISENVDWVNDNYATAMSAYVFALANRTVNAKNLLEKLEKNAIVSGNNKYWGDRGKTCTLNSLCSEISAYVLLAYAKLGKLIEAIPVESWMISQRNVHGTYANSYCTYLNLFSIAEIGKLQKKIEVFDAEVSLKTNFNEVHNFKINAKDPSPNPMVMLRSETRTVAINAKKTSGSGICYASIEFQYMRREENVKRNFDLDIYIQSREAKAATLRACSKFVSNGEVERASMTLIEIEAPSGYVFDKENNFEAQGLPQFRKRELKNLDTKENLYFESFDGTLVCATFKLIKINDVFAEKKSVAKIYDYNYPFHRATTFYNIDNNNCI